MFKAFKKILKARILKYFRKIEKTQQKIVTDHHRPGLRILPYYKPKLPENVFGKYQGKIIYFEDINASSSDEWSEV